MALTSVWWCEGPTTRVRAGASRRVARIPCAGAGSRPSGRLWARRPRQRPSVPVAYLLRGRPSSGAWLGGNPPAAALVGSWRLRVRPRGPLQKVVLCPVACPLSHEVVVDVHRASWPSLQSPDWKQVVCTSTRSRNKATSSRNAGGCFGRGPGGGADRGSCLAGLVHRDLRLGDLPPQPFHSLPLPQSGPFPDGGLRYGRDCRLGSVRGVGILCTSQTALFSLETLEIQTLETVLLVFEVYLERR